MRKKSKSKRNKSKPQTPGSAKLRKQAGVELDENNLLVLDEYPPKPIPISSATNPAKPTSSGTEKSARGSAGRGSGRTVKTQRTQRSNKGGNFQNFLNRFLSSLYRMFEAILVFLSGVVSELRTLLRRGRTGQVAALIGLGVVVLAIVFGSIYFLSRNNALSINVDGEQVAIVSMASVRSGGEDLSDELVTQAIRRIENRVAARVLINENIEFEPIRAARRYFLSADEAIIRLDASLTFMVEAAAIMVEGTRMSIVRSYDEAERILNILKEPHLGFGVEFEETGFVENVVIDLIYVNEYQLQDSSVALQILTSTLETAQDYTVVSGDSLYSIITRFGMTMDELLSMNPAIDRNAPLRIGTNLRLSVDRPLVSVRTVEARSFTTYVDAPVEHIYNPNHRTTHRRTIQFGTLGEATIIEHVIRVNSMEVERVEIDRIVTVEPTPEIIEIGTGS